jgi:hypothetical protein
MNDDTRDLLDNHVENFTYATRLIKFIIVIVGFVIFLYSRHAFIFFSAAVLPSIIVIFLDRAEHKCMSATVCTFNLIGVTPYLKQMYSARSAHDSAKDIISNPTAWLIIYTVTFIGIVIYMSLPQIISQIYVAKANMRISKLISHRNKICADWDIKVDDNAKEESFLD